MHDIYDVYEMYATDAPDTEAVHTLARKLISQSWHDRGAVQEDTDELVLSGR